jgi:hypothetical protein
MSQKLDTSPAVIGIDIGKNYSRQRSAGRAAAVPERMKMPPTEAALTCSIGRRLLNVWRAGSPIRQLVNLSLEIGGFLD